MYKRSTFALAFSLVVMSFCFFDALTNIDGAIAGVNGSPSSNGTNCSTNCHSGPAPADQDIFLITDIDSAGFEEGETYNMTIIGDGGSVTPGKMGFEVSIEDATGNHYGTIQKVDNETRLRGANFITHSAFANDVQDSGRSWDFTWTADNVTQDVNLYVAVNFANGNGLATGDVILTDDFLLEHDDQGIALGEDRLPELEIFPNPASDYLQLSADRKWGKSEIILYDLSGRKVSDLLWDFSYGHTRLDIGKLKEGNYILEIKGVRDYRSTHKIQVVR